MWAWLANLIAGPIIGKVIDGYKAKLAAGNDRDRMAADLAAKELAVDQRASELRTQLLIAEQGRWYTAIIRPLFAFPLIVYFWKILIWDKVLGWGATDPLTGMIGEWAGLIILAYFGGRTVEKVARVFRR
ncbi:MAG: hypothetical protein K8H87_16435 [Pseudorhodoplanes sp.]|nr:hypothetical protein [Pseudorhodoplanes sp.]